MDRSFRRIRLLRAFFSILVVKANSNNWFLHSAALSLVNNVVGRQLFFSVIAEAYSDNVGSICTALPTLLGPRMRITYGLHGDSNALTWQSNFVSLQSLMGCILSWLGIVASARTGLNGSVTAIMETCNILSIYMSQKSSEALRYSTGLTPYSRNFQNILPELVYQRVLHCQPRWNTAKQVLHLKTMYKCNFSSVND